MKKNLKFLIAAIVSIVSVSAVTGSAMQNNPDGGDNRYKKYEELIENQDQEQNVNSNNSEQNIFEKSEEEMAANKERFQKIDKIEQKIKNDSANPFKISLEKLKEILGISVDFQQQSDNFHNNIKEDEKNIKEDKKK